MTARTTHRVQRQVLELRVATSGEARAVSAELRAALDAHLASPWDEVLDAATGDGSTLRVDRLEVDLGRLPRLGLTDTLFERLGQALADILRDTTSGTAAAACPGLRVVRLTETEVQLERLCRFLATGAFADDAARSTNQELESSLESLARGSPETLARALRSLDARSRVAHRLAHAFGGSTRSAVLGALAGSAAAPLERVIGALAAGFDEPAVLGALTGSAAAPLERVIGALAAVFDHPAARASARMPDRQERAEAWLWERLFGELLARPAEASTPGASELCRTVLTALDLDGVAAAAVRAALDRIDHAEAKRMWLDGGGVGAHAKGTGARRMPTIRADRVAPKRASGEPSGGVPGRRAHAGTAVLASSPAAFAKPHAGGAAVPGAPVDRDAATASRDASRPTTPAAPGRSPSPAREPRVAREAPEPEGAASARAHADHGVSRASRSSADELLWAAHAGLVLTWPYLQRLYSSLGFVVDRRFVGPDAAERAVLLAAHLADGGVEWSEADLLLEKVLCGWPPTEPIQTRLDLREAERCEADALLRSLLLHWSALKSSSIAALRQSFLSRNGCLSWRNGGYQLQIPRTGIDVLIDRLPFGIGFVRLPWMEQPLYVEW